MSYQNTGIKCGVTTIKSVHIFNKSDFETDSAWWHFLGFAYGLDEDGFGEDEEFIDKIKSIKIRIARSPYFAGPGVKCWASLEAEHHNPKGKEQHHAIENSEGNARGTD